MIFDAALLARGWRSVAIASGADKDQPQFHHAVLVEQHSTGVRLVATDTFMLLHSWIPDVDAMHDVDDAVAPDLDEAPITTAIALDPHGRAKGFLAHAQQLAGGDNDGLIQVKLDLGVKVVEQTESLAGLEPRWCVLDMPKRERLQLRLYEGAWPEWRALFAGINPRATARIALSLDIVARLAALAKVQEGARLGWTFTGPKRPARVELIDGWPSAEGLVMPCRWDLDNNAPAVVPAEPDASAAEPTP